MFPKINKKFLILGALLTHSTFANKAEVFTHCKTPGQFALTFNDGPNPETTPIALEILEKYNVKATFFINGNILDQNPETIEIVKNAFLAEHDIGSHTYDHVDLFTALDEGTLQHNVDEMTTKIESIIGVKPAYFRPPNGSGAQQETDPQKIEKSNQIQEYLGERGYNIIMWNSDTNDLQHKEDKDKVIASLNEQLTLPGVSPQTHSFITLLHDIQPSTINIILPAIIEYIQSLNYKFVSLSECIGISPYQGVVDDSANDNLNANNSTKPTRTIVIKPIETNNSKSDAITLQHSMLFTFIIALLTLIF